MLIRPESKALAVTVVMRKKFNVPLNVTEPPPQVPTGVLDCDALTEETQVFDPTE
jgi:hypothetical protein